MSGHVLGWPSLLTIIKTDLYLEFTDLTLVYIWVQQSFLKDAGFWVVFDNCLDFLSLVQFILFSFSVIIPDKKAGWMLCWLIACLRLDLLFMEMSTCVRVSAWAGKSEREFLSEELGLISRSSFPSAVKSLQMQEIFCKAVRQAVDLLLNSFRPTF